MSADLFYELSKNMGIPHGDKNILYTIFQNNHNVLNEIEHSDVRTFGFSLSELEELQEICDEKPTNTVDNNRKLRSTTDHVSSESNNTEYSNERILGFTFTELIELQKICGEKSFNSAIINHDEDSTAKNEVQQHSVAVDNTQTCNMIRKSLEVSNQRVEDVIDLTDSENTDHLATDIPLDNSTCVTNVVTKVIIERKISKTPKKSAVKKNGNAFTCEICGNEFNYKIGLMSHLNFAHGVDCNDNFGDRMNETLKAKEKNESFKRKSTTDNKPNKNCSVKFKKVVNQLNKLKRDNDCSKTSNEKTAPSAGSSKNDSDNDFLGFDSYELHDLGIMCEEKTAKSAESRKTKKQQSKKDVNDLPDDCDKLDRNFAERPKLSQLRLFFKTTKVGNTIQHYTCNHCSIILSRDESLNHLITCSKIFHYKCQMCHLKFFSELRFKKHICKKHGIMSFVVCKNCSEIFADNLKLENHKKMCIPNDGAKQDASITN